jgi:putative ubiquitin-RnfH superfamily antitoxin RatB of RatAB toxin-antitoxin module
MRRAETGERRVSVVYLRPGLAFERRLVLPASATVGDAIEASGLRREVAELATGTIAAGVFGELRGPDSLLEDGDRIEIYRQLTIDPKEARRIRAEVRRRRRARPG